MNQIPKLQSYQTPRLERIVVDSEISLILSSVEAWGDPEVMTNTPDVSDEVLLSP